MTQPLADATRPRPTGLTVAGEPRAVLIANALKAVSRRARTPRGVFVSSGAAPERRWQHLFAWVIVTSFFAVVAVPNLVAGVYLAFFASDQYATETRFALRGGEPSVLDQVGGLLGMAAANRAQDSLIVVDYIRSRSMVEAVDKSLDLRRLFARDDVDFLSRFNPMLPDEDLLRYWRRHVDANIESMSGIITVVVRAFTPADSLAIAHAVSAQSEKLVNELSERARNDALRQARGELGRAKDVLQDRITAMRDVRNAEGILDTAKTSEAMTRMLSELRLELIRMQQNYDAQRRTIAADAPQLRVLEAQIVSMRDQIRDLERQMTGGQASAALSGAMGRFNMAQLEKHVAEQQYMAAAGGYERARVELETQNIYLASFLTPVLAQEALYPKRLWLMTIVLLITLALWSGGVGAAVMVRNHVAV